MERVPQTVRDRVQTAFDGLTRAERQAVNALMRNYPVSGLGSITAFAQAAEVSTPTVARLVQKIGFKRYPDFQAALRAEVEERLSSPLTKHERWAGRAPSGHILNRFPEAAIRNFRQTLDGLDPAEFDAARSLLADEERAVFSVGGRITHPLADYFCTHMGMIRDRVTLLPPSGTGWVQSVIAMAPGDVLVAFDIRRYQKDMLRLAEVAAGRGCGIVLFTDQWISPVAAHAACRFDCRVEVPSAWDSVASILVMLETLIAGVQETTWSATGPRLREFEALYDLFGLFR